MNVNRALPDGTYVDLVRSLYATLSPTAIMAVCFIAVGALVLRETPDSLLAALTVIGGFAALARLGVVGAHCREAATERLDLARARLLERRFAIAYFVFAAAFGAFSARAFVIANADAHMLVVGLLFGYGAGVSAGISMRLWIAVPAMIIGIVPATVVAMATPSFLYVATGALLAVFLAGGIQSTVRRYCNAAANITLRRTFTTLARADNLTGLANRLALREAFDQIAGQSRRGDILAVHCLDLDKFKPVNDRYGHPAGDALLRAVSERLNGLLRRGDIAARMGGDEFVILQTGARHEGEAEMLARRIVRAVAQPYSIDGTKITIGTSVGYALHPEHGADLDSLIACADEALCQVKREGGGIAAYGAAPVVVSIRGSRAAG